MKHSLAYIHPDAKIGENVTIEPFSSISADVEIGEGTWVGPNVTIMDGARIGKNCRIFPGAVVSAIPQDLKFQGEKTYAFIGDNTTIRECVTINRGTAAKGKTVVGNNCLLMAYVHVAHDSILGNNCIVANSVAIAGEVVIGDFVNIGGMSAIHQFSLIGSHAMVSGGSLVRKDVPPYVKAAREPLSYVGVNVIGLRRRGFTDETINQIQDVYRVIFQQKMATTKALDYIEANLPQSIERDEIVKFVRGSERGIMKGFQSE